EGGRAVPTITPASLMALADRRVQPEFAGSAWLRFVNSILVRQTPAFIPGVAGSSWTPTVMPSLLIQYASVPLEPASMYRSTRGFAAFGSAPKAILAPRLIRMPTACPSSLMWDVTARG